MAGAASVESEDELFEVGLQVRASQSVIDAQGPGLQVGKDTVDPGQDDMGGHRPDDVRLMGQVRCTGIAGPAVGLGCGSRGEVGVEERMCRKQSIC